MNPPNEPNRARLGSEAVAAKRPPRRRSPHHAAFQVAPDLEPVPINRGTMIGDYRVERRLDEGGMGTVYAAVHPVIDKRVAIKVLHPHVARQEEAVARFIQEARAVNAIGHPGIVDIFGFGRFVDGRHYITMEYLDGQQLLAFLNETGPIGPLEMLPVARQLAESLAAAHSKGVVHRDMKPENVFLSITAASAKSEPWPPRTKILDFGLAKLIEVEFDDQKPRTRAGVTVGTPYYMSPEQCRGKQVDQRADIYALGVMMYEMITGRVPFYAPESVDVLYMHLTQQPEPPSKHRTVPPEIEKLILKCMAKSAAERPNTMDALLAALDQIQQRFSPNEGQRERPEEELRREASAFFGGVDDSVPKGAEGLRLSRSDRDNNRITRPVPAAPDDVPSTAKAGEPAAPAGGPPAVDGAAAPAVATVERARSADPVPSLPSAPGSASSAPATGAVPSLPTPVGEEVASDPVVARVASEPEKRADPARASSDAPALASVTAPAPTVAPAPAPQETASAPAPAPTAFPAAPVPTMPPRGDVTDPVFRAEDPDPETTLQIRRPDDIRISRRLLWAVVLLQTVVILLLMLLLLFRN